MKRKYNRKNQLSKTKKGGMRYTRKQGNKYKSIKYNRTSNTRRKNKCKYSRRRRRRIRKRIIKGGSTSCSDFNTNKEILDITTGGGTMWDGGNQATWGKTGQYYGLESHFDRFDKSFNI